MSLSNYFFEGVHVVKSLIHYMTEGPSIYVIPNTNIAKVHVFHRGKLMAIYVPIDPVEFEIGSNKYVEVDGYSLNPPPVSGIKVNFTCEDFNASKINIFHPLTEDIDTYTTSSDDASASFML
jgi:hypothetical protein